LKVSYIILTCNRSDELLECIKSIKSQTYRNQEIVLIDNGSKEDQTKFISTKFKRVKCVRLKTNTGVCAGRNVGIKHASGDILVFLDDDEILPSKYVTKRIVDKFKSDSSIGVLTFKVVNFFDKKVERRTIPSKNKELAESEFETSYFLGGANATRKEVFNECGLLAERFFYSMEESDLSYRIMKTNHRIVYYPKIKFIHKHSLKQRKAWQHIYYPFRNRIWMITKYLPWRYALSQLIIWGAYYFQLSLRQGFIRYYFKSIYDGFNGLNTSLRLREEFRLDSVAIRKIKKLNGRLLY